MSDKKFVLWKFNTFSNLKYGFSNKADGSMHRHLRKENRAKYFEKIGIDPQKVVTADLIRGAKVQRVDESLAGTIVSDTDGLVTDTKDLVLTVTGADCFPVYFYDPARLAIGLIHVGWRGLLKGIVQNTVKVMMDEFKTDPSELIVGIGPGIRDCHFEISPEDEHLYAEYPNFILKKEEGFFVDIPGIIKEQLNRCGLKAENIEDSDLCTFCDSAEYFSYRRDKPSEIEVMAAHIGLM